MSSLRLVPLSHFLCDGESEKNLVCFFAVLGDASCCLAGGTEEVAGVLAVFKGAVLAVALCTCPTVAREASSSASLARDDIGDVADVDVVSAGLVPVSATPS